MKNLLKFTAILALHISCSITSNAQTNSAEKSAAISNAPVEAKFQVVGVCNACKKRIENAAYIKGVKIVEWDKATQMLSVIYRPSKVSVKEIQTAVAAIGHDTQDVKADDKVYAKLPGCCQYRDGIEIH